MSFKPGEYGNRQQGGRVLEVKYRGKEYAIPEMWLAAQCGSLRHSVQDAIETWATQADLAAQEGSANLYVLGIVAICIIPVIVFLGHLVAYLHGATTTLSC